jgi:hypothetical protein
MLRLKILLISTYFFLLFLPFSFSSSLLSTGDILLVYINSTGSNDEFGFVSLVDLAEGTQLYFTDKGVLHQTNTLRSGEGIYTYKVPTGGLKAGTVIQFTKTAPDFTKKGSFGLATGGDQLFIFQDSDPNNNIIPEKEPHFIFAINLASRETGDNCTASSTNDTGIPPSLKATTFGGEMGTFLALGNAQGCKEDEDRAIYKGSLFFPNKEAALNAMTSPDNWFSESKKASSDYECFEQLIKNTKNIFDTPIIQVSGNDHIISYADFSPRIEDFTDFGSHSVGNQVISKTFTIKNTGKGTLTLGGSSISIGKHSGDFSIASQPDKGLNADGSTTFTINFKPTKAQLSTDTIKIIHDASNQNPFLFLVEGTGVCTPATINTHPENKEPCLGSNTSFSIAATSPNNGKLLYQWAISADNGATFTNLSNNEQYTDAQTSQLKITNVTTDLNEKIYRVTIKNVLNEDTCIIHSNTTLLTVTTLNITEKITAPTCKSNNDGKISLTISGGTAPYTYSWSNGATVAEFPKGLKAGSYAVTITDNQNCSSNKSMQVPDVDLACPKGKGACAQLYFSKYLEGSSFNKALEIHNPSAEVIDLSNYQIQIFNNGATQAKSTFSFGNKELAPNEVFIMAHAKHQLTDLNNIVDTLLGAGTVLNFNGDDALLLIHNQDTLDIIGRIGQRPNGAWNVNGTNGQNGTTANRTLIRNNSINIGQANWDIAAANEWDILPQNSTTGFGKHETVCSKNQIITEYKDSIICLSETTAITVNFKSAATFESTNQFQLQLSDDKGLFETPLVLTSMNAKTNTGTMNAIIPTDIKSGNNYRLRVVSTQPIITGIPNQTNIGIYQNPAITGRDTNIVASQSIDLNTLIEGEHRGVLAYSTSFDNWNTTNIVQPYSSTTYFVRDSIPSTTCMDTAAIRVTVRQSNPIFNYDDSDGDGKPDFKDPCSCDDPKNQPNKALFHDVFTIQSLENEQWILTKNDGQFLNADGNAYPIGTVMPAIPISPSTYQIEFYHASDVAANFSVSRNNGVDNFDQISSVCSINACRRASIPTFSQWGLILFSLLIINLGVFYVLKLEREKVMKG